MRKITMIIAGLICALLFGCNSAVKIIDQKIQNERSGIFTEIKNEEIPGKGFATVNIIATIKTHLEGYYLYESANSRHGKPVYSFVINIDGQAATWNVDGQKEILPLYDEKGETSHNPNAGEGIKYTLAKKIRLRPGLHKVFFGLPSDKYFTELNITLQEGREATLEFKPVYKYKTYPHRIPSFKGEIKKYDVYLNNTRIN